MTARHTRTAWPSAGLPWGLEFVSPLSSCPWLVAGTDWRQPVGTIWVPLPPQTEMHPWGLELLGCLRNQNATLFLFTGEIQKPLIQIKNTNNQARGRGASLCVCVCVCVCVHAHRHWASLDPQCMLPVTWGSKAEALTVARSSESVVSRPAGTSYKSFFFFLFCLWYWGLNSGPTS
jgi:hypothetical protein